MILEEKSNYVLAKSEAATLHEVFTELTSNETLTKHNIILELSENLNINTEEIAVFLDYSQNCKANGTSFVIIKKGIDADDFDESINIVPTLQEAEDIIEMEDIERDLGF